MQIAESKPADGRLRIYVEGESLEGKTVNKGVLLPLGKPGPGAQRLKEAGLTIMAFGGDVTVAAVKFGSAAEKMGLEQSFKIVGLEVPTDRPDKEWIFIPAILLLAGIIAIQRRRLQVEKAS
jgi:hypothetical protein